MSDSKRLIPVLHFTDVELAKKSVDAMEELNITAKYIPIDKVTEKPDWLSNSKGGWVLFIESEHFERGMTKLAKIMGYSPD